MPTAQDVEATFLYDFGFLDLPGDLSSLLFPFYHMRSQLGYDDGSTTQLTRCFIAQHTYMPSLRVDFPRMAEPEHECLNVSDRICLLASRPRLFVNHSGIC